MNASQIRKNRRYFDALKHEIQYAKDIASRTDELAWKAEGVSGWSIGEQLEHILLTDAFILRQIDQLDPEVLRRGKPKPSFWGWVVLLLGFRQRGVAQSPEQVVPRNPSAEHLAELFADIDQSLSRLEDKIETTDLTTWIYTHPRLGDFSAQQWLRFCEVHHQHHHRIIADIHQARA